MKRHEGAAERDNGLTSPSILKRGDGTILKQPNKWKSHDGAAGVPGNHATTGIATRDDFPPLSEEISWTSLRPK